MVESQPVKRFLPLILLLPAWLLGEKGPKAKPTNASGVIESKTDAGGIQITMFKIARTAGK